jgi:hypothetical protein
MEGTWKQGICGYIQVQNRMDSYGLWLDDHGIVIRFQVEARDFPPVQKVQTGYEAHPASYMMDTGGCFHVIKWQGREAGHSLPFSAEVSGGTISPLPHTF